MNLERCRLAFLVGVIGLLTASAAVATPVVGQVDDFEDGTTQGWDINALGMGAPPPAALPANIPTGGPGGVDDSFLQLTSLGGQGGGGRLTVLNFAPRWTGNYLAAGVNAITMDVNNLGGTDLALRLVFEDPTVGPPENIAFSTNPVLVSAGSGWTTVTFLFRPSDLTAGLGDVLTALSNTTVIRLYHSPDPNFPNPVSPTPAVVAVLGVDNITAAAVPEPSTPALVGTGGLALLGICRRRRASA